MKTNSEFLNQLTTKNMYAHMFRLNGADVKTQKIVINKP